MKTAEKVLKEYVSCECGEIYTSRGLVAPDCPLCSMHSCYIEAMKTYGIEIVKELTEKDYVTAVQEGDDEYPTVLWDENKIDSLIEQIESQ
jgi:hypothetical protein